MLKNKKVILIMTDTQRHDMCNCYKETGLKTPNIDKLAREGVRFEKAYSTQPVCQPARAAIFTGQYPHSCGSWTNCMGISDNTHTVGERLFDNGIHTAYIGKWHLDGGDYFGLGKAPKGWDAKYWYDMRNYLDELTEKERINSRRVNLMKEQDIDEGFTYGHRCANRAIDFLENDSKDDFFLVVSFDEPHDPSLCPQPYADMYKDFEFPKSENIYDTLDGKPDYQKVWAGDSLFEDKNALKLNWQAFFGCNSFVDYEIGRVVDAAKAYAPDAVIMYTSDHGDFIHSHSLFAKGPAAYEEITHIPFIISGKGIDAGRVVKNPVSHINIAPTVLEFMGVDVPPVYDGKSLVAELENESIRTNENIFIEFGRYEMDHDGFGAFQPMRSAYNGRYKLSINLMSQDELYDLESDTAEMVNLIDRAEFADIRNHLHDAIIENMYNTRDPFRGYYWLRRPWRTDAKAPKWGDDGLSRQRIDDAYENRQLSYRDGMPITASVRENKPAD
ncbi:MAG: sulfatase-like hydrolase/transferase [Oscillospiraceae bacterium]